MALSVRVCLAPNLEISSTEMSSSRRIQANSRRKLNLYKKKYRTIWFHRRHAKTRIRKQQRLKHCKKIFLRGKFLSKIATLDHEFIKKLHIITIVVDSPCKIDVEKFRVLTHDTARSFY